MRLKQTLFLLIILLGFLNSYGQLKSEEVDNFYKTVWKNLNTKKHFKDSLAFYTCNLQIELSKSNNYKPLITSSDTTVSNRIENLEILQLYDFKKMIGKMEKVKLILPIGIVILNSKHGQKLIKTDELDKIMKMFYHPTTKDDRNMIFYLTPYLAYDDKIEYN